MTSSQEVKPLPCPACGSSTAQRAISCPLWQIVCDLRDGGCGLSSRLADTREEAVRYWNRRRELESRVSPGAAPDPLTAVATRLEEEAEGLKRNPDGGIRRDGIAHLITHSSVAAAIYGAMRDEYERASRSSGEDQPSTEKRVSLTLPGCSFPSCPTVSSCDEWGCRRPAVESGEDQTAAATDGPYCPGCGLLLDWIDRNDGEHKAGCKGASLSPQPSKLTSEELAEAGITREELDERIAAIGRGEGIPHDEAVARVRERIEQAAPQPAEPTGAKNEEDMTCDRCGQSIGGAPFVRLTELRGVRHFSCAVRATHDRDDRVFRGASHPAEPETPSHLCPRCGEACVCAEGFDGDRCQHYRIGCKSVAPAEPERETNTYGLPCDESTQRNAVCDLLTKELVGIGHLADEAGERPTIDLRDEKQVRGLVRFMTAVDSEGRDGPWGEEKKAFWRQLGRILSGAEPERETEEERQKRTEASIPHSLTPRGDPK